MPSAPSRSDAGPPHQWPGLVIAALHRGLGADDVAALHGIPAEQARAFIRRLSHTGGLPRVTVPWGATVRRLTTR
jgi:hypothetical protein